MQNAVRERTKTILVIDDDPLICRIMAEYLNHRGYSALMAENGKIGMDIFQQENPDLVLVDLLMPVMGGMEVLKSLRSLSPEIPVIVVSGIGGMEDAIAALRLGAWDFLTKPIQDMNLLSHTVDKALERADLLKESRLHQEYLEQEVRRRTLELEHANQELIKTQQQLWHQLEQAQRMECMGMLAGGIAHDFNNILASIFCSAEIALESIPPEYPEHQDLQRILRASSRGKTLVQRILSFTRTGPLEFLPFHLGEVVRESIQFLKSILPASIELSLIMDEECCIMQGDPVQIQQVIMNLVTNAVYAVRNNQNPRLEIQICSTGEEQESGEWIQLMVSDNGIGIAQENVVRVFDPLYTTKGKKEGSGLGLYLVKEIVTRHKGHVDIKSEPGQGTCFTLCFPQTGARKVERIQAVPLEIGTGKETLLLADDDPDIVESMGRVLTGLGYRVLKAGNGLQAVEMLRSRREEIDLAILDLDMPLYTGAEISRELLLSAPGIPLIILTGRIETPPEKLLSISNVKEVLFKPMDKNSIALSIRTALEGRKAEFTAQC
ncbi:MAG: response regulator [Desulfovibrionales bacterium]